MHFDLGDDRRMIADSFRRFVAEKLPFDPSGDAAHDPAAWGQLAELGLAATLFSESDGGFGGSGFDIAVLFEEAGRALVTQPLLGTLMAGRALATTGEQADTLARIVSGEAVATLAEDGPVNATQDGDGWRLSGTKTVVPFGEEAELLVVAAGDRLFLVVGDAPGVTKRGYPNIDGGRSAEVAFDATPAIVLGDGEAPLAAARDAGLVALAAEALGLMETIKAATLDYLKTRQQFSQPIGRFQALQHRMADMALEVEGMRSAVINAAAALDEGRRRPLHAAKHSAGRIGRLVAEEAVQLHGGIGMTWELPLAHAVKRLVMIDHQLGDEDEHLAHYIALGQERADA